MPTIQKGRRLLVISDVGGADSRHIGDEAMLEANLAALRNLIPEVVFTIVSRDPAWTGQRYGVDAVAPFGFSRNPDAAIERAAMLDHLLAEAVSFEHLKNGSKVGDNPTVAAVAHADGVVVSGGGNLSSTWPDLLYERIAALSLARVFGKPSVVLGQTIGPRLRDEERRLLSEALRTARFVGVRELPSALLGQELQVPAGVLWYQSDDALFLETEGRPVSFANPGSGHRIAVTIDPQVRAADAALFDAMVSQLRELSQKTSAVLILIPHVFGNESANVPSDWTEAQLLAERLGLSRTVIAAELDARQAKQITVAADLVISSRYHPLVFGLSAGVPSLGIFGDEYCRIKLTGALAHANLDRWIVTYDDLRCGSLLSNTLELWQRRAEVRGQLEMHRITWRAEYEARWSRISQALDSSTSLPTPDANTVFGRPPSEVAPFLGSAREARRQWLLSESMSQATSPFHRSGPQVEANESEKGFSKSVRRYLTALRAKVRRRKL